MMLPSHLSSELLPPWKGGSVRSPGQEICRHEQPGEAERSRFARIDPVLTYTRAVYGGHKRAMGGKCQRVKADSRL